MGLAASQSRFLGLTARKSNVEYKGQQINQARTALSNRVNNLYQKYTNLNVPVPPSKQDYVKTKYTFETASENFSIGSMSKISSGDYKDYYNVTLEYEESVPKLYMNYAENSVVTAKKENDSYSYLNIKLGKEEYTYDKNNEEGSEIKKIVVDNMEDDDLNNYQGLKALIEKYNKTSGTYYMFLRNGMPYYTSDYELDDTQFSEEDSHDAAKKVYYGPYSFDYQGSTNKTSSVNAIAAITKSSSGRLSTIHIVHTDDESAKEIEGMTYSITVSQEDDEAGYSDAMNQYTYQKMIYENKVEKLNRETDKLHKEDRALELQLNQLDTEQKAISTEMETIQKVMKETIDKIFKTYDG